MMTSWVPREAKLTVIHIPPQLDFLADIAHTIKVGGAFKVVPVFSVLNVNVPDIFGHVGDFELECVVLGENFATTSGQSNSGSMASRRHCCHCPSPRSHRGNRAD